MATIEDILNELQSRASEVADKVDIDTRVDQAKDLANKVTERIKTDPKAQTAAMGGGALLALLMATRGGRKMLGTVAKTGAVAAVGAVAYQAWKTRTGRDDASDAMDVGFTEADAGDERFARALVETMALAAASDGVIDEDERAALQDSLTEAGGDPSLLTEAQSRGDVLDRITSYAGNPNQAHELYAAACVGCGERSYSETSFLYDLADRLAIHPRTAEDIRSEVR